MTVVYQEQQPDGVVQRWHRHTGDQGQPQLTVESVADVEPAFKEARLRSNDAGKPFRFKGLVHRTVLDEVAKINAQRWGVTVGAAFREIMQGRTDRAKDVWRMLATDRDYRKFQRQ